MSVINTNITSVIAQKNLTSSKASLTSAMERLSSGLRINSAKDDAAGQAVANRMTAQVKGLAQAQRNANDGISLAQTAEGALNQINDNLQRVRELTVQAQNGTNSASDIDSIQTEVNARLTEIDRVAKETNFNGIKVLDAQGTFSIQVGANDGETIDIEIKAPAFVEKTSSAAAEGWRFDITSEIDNTTSSSATVNGELRTVKAKGFDVLTSTGTGSSSPADNPLATIDSALKAVDDQRSALGAVQNRFESAITNLSTNQTNLEAARSRIQDADYAVEVSNMTRAQILQQAGTSVLSQANQVPQGVLSLLR